MSRALFPEWMDSALCTQVGTELFFPPKGNKNIPAKRICNACPVAAECLQFALDNDIEYGIYGGLSRFDRVRLKAQRRRDAA